MTDKTTDAPEATAAPEGPYVVSEGMYKRLTTGLGGFTMALIACFALAGAIVLITPRSHKELLPTVDYNTQLYAMRLAAPYPVWAPEGLPAKWRATSSRVTGLDGSGPEAWHLGFVTPADAYAALEESNEQPVGELLWRMTNSRKPVGTQQVAGETWQQYYRKDKDQRSLVRTLPGVTLVVTGKASYAELAVLAGSLKVQPKLGTPSPTPS